MKALLLILLFVAPLVQAKMTSATWGLSPASPVYVGQPYELTLTVETDPNEEIAEYRLTQDPGTLPAEPTIETVNGRRRTTFRWTQVEYNAKLKAIPEGELGARIMVVQTFGFARYQRSVVQKIMVPAFSYEVKELPGEARGAPIGDFKLVLSADQVTFTPGDVRILTATLTAEEGYVPEIVHFVLKDEAGGRLYPFRITSRTHRQLTAQAYYVTSGETDLLLELQPFKAFNLTHRKLADVVCPPLLLRLQAEADDAMDDVPITFGQSEVQGLPLRFAPTDRAPVIGILVAPLTRHETFEEWTRVSCAEGEGWIRTTLLGE